MNEFMHDDRLARITLSYVIDSHDEGGMRWLSMVTPEEAVTHLRKLDVDNAMPEARTWKARLIEAPDPASVLAKMEALGGGVLIPSDPEWPVALNDLGDSRPICLYYRGKPQNIPPLTSAVAITGSRDCTSYGAATTGDLAYSLAQRGVTIISGGAYGVDAHAHRAALAGYQSSMGYAPTISVMAGGVDRYYPSGNGDLLRAIAPAGGLILSELPPGYAPTRYRFIQRHRIIAALAGTTLIPEARWRSGALGMAHQAKALGRHVAAVPGSVHSANSMGCHRLIRDGVATLVGTADELIELHKATA